MGYDFSYRIYSTPEELPEWDSSTFDYDDLDFSVSRHNSELENGDFTTTDLKTMILELATSLSSDNFSDLDDVIEALKVYASILKEMRDTDIVRIVYE